MFFHSASIYTSRIHVFFLLSLYRKLKRMCAMTLSVSPWISGAFAFTVSSSTSSSSSSSNPSSFHFSFSSGGRVACRAHYVSKDLKFVLHHALDALGIDIAHAKVWFVFRFLFGFFSRNVFALKKIVIFLFDFGEVDAFLLWLCCGSALKLLNLCTWSRMNSIFCYYCFLI